MVGNSMGTIYPTSPYMYRTADAVVFPFQDKLFSSDSSSVDWWAPKGQSRSYTTYEQMKWVNCFKVEYLVLVKFEEGHMGKNCTCRQWGAWKRYLGNIRFFVENQNHPFYPKQPAHTSNVEQSCVQVPRTKVITQDQNYVKNSATNLAKKHNLTLLQYSKAFFILTSNILVKIKVIFSSLTLSPGKLQIRNSVGRKWTLICEERKKASKLMWNTNSKNVSSQMQHII